MLNRKILICFYSPFSGRGWKAQQLEKIVSFFRSNRVDFWGVGIRPASRLSSDPLVVEFRLPLLFVFLAAKFKNIFSVFGISYFPYLIGERVFSWVARRQVRRSNARIMFCKPRPVELIEVAKQSGKLVLVEFGEMHPEFVRERLGAELVRFDIKSKNIFLDSSACSDSLKALELADRVIVLSEASRDSMVRFGIDSARIVVAGLHFRGSPLLDCSVSKKELPRVFVAVAEHSFIKGTHRLLEAWRAAGIVNCQLMIVGELSADMSEYVTKQGAFPNVVFTGHLDLGDFYNNFNCVGVSVSLAEGYARVVYEYMSCGFPVVVSEVSTCDIVSDGHNGFVVRSESQLVDALRCFSRDFELWDAMGARSKKLVSQVERRCYEDILLTTCNEMIDEYKH